MMVIICRSKEKYIVHFNMEQLALKAQNDNEET